MASPVRVASFPYLKSRSQLFGLAGRPSMMNRGTDPGLVPPFSTLSRLPVAEDSASTVLSPALHAAFTCTTMRRGTASFTVAVYCTVMYLLPLDLPTELVFSTTLTSLTETGGAAARALAAPRHVTVSNERQPR